MLRFVGRCALYSPTYNSKRQETTSTPTNKGGVNKVQYIHLWDNLDVLTRAGNGL